MKFYAIGSLTSFMKWLMAAAIIGAMIFIYAGGLDITTQKHALAGWCLAISQILLLMGLIAFCFRPQFGGFLLIVGVCSHLAHIMLLN